MGIVRQRNNNNKASPPSTPSSVHSGSRNSTSLEGGDINNTNINIDANNGSHVGSPRNNNNSARRKRLQTPRTMSTLMLTLFAVTTISSVSFLCTLTTLRRRHVSSLPQGVVGVNDKMIMTTPYQAQHEYPKGIRGENQGTEEIRGENQVKEEQDQFHRIVFLEGAPFEPSHNYTVDDDEAMMHRTESTQPVPSEKSHLKDCVPLADWMTDSYPNCNHFHELSLPQSLHWNESVRALEDDQLDTLGRGWFRTTFYWDRPQEAVVLKTLRIEREFLSEYYDLHNRDALAMERLTASPFVVDVYGYCGQSAINELADFPVDDMQYLEKLSRRLRGLYDHDSLKIRLGIAASIAEGLVDVHRAGGSGRPLMAHYDLNPRNVALFHGARPKINDFNIAEFLHYNPKTNKTCGFPSRMHAPWWRAPEEVEVDKEIFLDEKVDVYALGSTLFHLYTSYSPRGKMEPAREEMVRVNVINGKKPIIRPPILRNSTDPIAATFRKVINLCHEPDPSKRASAADIADILAAALLREKETVEAAGTGSGGRSNGMQFASPVENESEDTADAANFEKKG